MPTALMVHGLDDAFLAKHPAFAAHVDELLAFMADAPLVIHNAEFDLGFLNAELKRLGRPALACRFTDTLSLARRRYPGSPASLDALCRRFAIDLSAREQHGAKLDCELLAAVYLELVGGRQPGLDLGAASRRRRHRRARPTSAPAAAARALARRACGACGISEKARRAAVARGLSYGSGTT